MLEAGQPAEEGSKTSLSTRHQRILPSHSLISLMISIHIHAGFPDMNYPCDFHVPLPKCSFMEFSYISEDELVRIGMKSPSKGCSLGPFPTRMVKLDMDPLLPLITALINSCLASGDVPENMKVARLSLFLKQPWISNISRTTDQLAICHSSPS